MNNRDRNFTKGKTASRLVHLEADVERCIDEMVRIDRQEEDEARTGKVAQLARRYGRVRQEIKRLKAMDKALADAPDGQISLTDPDARAMATSARHSGLVGYSAQCAVDAGIRDGLGGHVPGIGRIFDAASEVLIEGGSVFAEDGTGRIDQRSSTLPAGALSGCR